MAVHLDLCSVLKAFGGLFLLLLYRHLIQIGNFNETGKEAAIHLYGCMVQASGLELILAPLHCKPHMSAIAGRIL